MPPDTLQGLRCMLGRQAGQAVWSQEGRTQTRGKNSPKGPFHQVKEEGGGDDNQQICYQWSCGTREPYHWMEKRTRFFPKTATNSLDRLWRLFTSSGGKNVQWILTWGNSNYLSCTFPFSRTVRLPILHLRWVDASLTKPAVAVGESSHGKINFCLWINEKCL